MGMSASQARLLSITARLTNNEFRSQTITNAKLRLATESKQASQVYMDSLNSQELMYMYYGEDGENQKFELTPSIIYEYAPLKNQFAMINPSGKMLVSYTDSENFKNTTNLYDFLDCYGLVEDREIVIKKTQVRNPDYDDYLEKVKEWEGEKPDPDDYMITKHRQVPDGTIQTWKHTNSKVYDAIHDISCFGIVQNTGQRCYMHVLAALLGRGTFTTSDGNTFTIQREEDIGWKWNSCSDEEARTMDSLREEMKSDPVYDQAYDGQLNTEAHGIVSVGGDGSDALKYNAEGGGNCWQKCIDLAWELHWGYDGSSTGGHATEDELKKFWYFVELDLGDGYMEETEQYKDEEYEEPDKDAYDDAVEEWENNEPASVPMTIVAYEETQGDIIVNDKDKSQWYTNLWHKMNGSDTANLVRLKNRDKDGDGTYTSDFIVPYIEKSTKSVNYEVFDENLVNNAEWLQFALEHGVISLAQAQFYDPSQDSEKVFETKSDAITWQSIIYTNAPDIVSQNDEEAIAKAEVQYKKALKKIQSKDKKYDQDLKKLDAEHNALQTEYESIKEIIQKNTDRSFKAFS